MKKIVAGIVLFNPQIRRLEENINSIISQVESVILFDNGSSNLSKIESIIANKSKLILIHNNYNIGIAAALNRIFKYAKKMYNADFVLTIDQDSVCPMNLIHEYLRFYNEKVGIYTPKIKDINIKNYSEEKEKAEFCEIKKCITSGSLTSFSAWNSVNGFDETMFIDNVDFDFCKRIRKKGYKIVKVNTVSIKHELGHIKVYNTVFGKILVKNHNAFRKYYIARNTIYMARKDRNVFIVIIAYMRIIKQLLLVLIFEKNKVKKLKSLLRGTYVGSRIRIEKKWC